MTRTSSGAGSGVRAEKEVSVFPPDFPGFPSTVSSVTENGLPTAQWTFGGIGRFGGRRGGQDARQLSSITMLTVKLALAVAAAAGPPAPSARSAAASLLARCAKGPSRRH